MSLPFDNTPHGRDAEGRYLAEKGMPVDQKPGETWYHFNDRKNAADDHLKNRS